MRLIDVDDAQVRIRQMQGLKRSEIAMIEVVLHHIPTYEPPPNDPLTLEELWEMDGEPVWIAAKHGECFADVLHNVAKSEGRIYIRLVNHWYLQENGYGATWLAYRRKPKEEK